MAVIVDESKCSGCGVCVDTCAVGALALDGDVVKCNDDCIDCGVCVDECPTEALSLP